MFFTQIDTISDIQPGQALSATKCVTMAEEYLQDHFPGFPVMPGVLMLEAMTQASAWLIRITEDFEHSMVVLHQAKNVKYAGFVEPGQVLNLNVEWIKQDDQLISLKSTGHVGDRLAVSGRLTIRSYNLEEQSPDLANSDVTIRHELRRAYQLLIRPPAAV